jgi:hypothetical protein
MPLILALVLAFGGFAGGEKMQEQGAGEQKQGAPEGEARGGGPGKKRPAKTAAGHVETAEKRLSERQRKQGGERDGERVDGVGPAVQQKARAGGQFEPGENGGGEAQHAGP